MHAGGPFVLFSFGNLNPARVLCSPSRFPLDFELSLASLCANMASDIASTSYEVILTKYGSRLFLGLGSSPQVLIFGPLSLSNTLWWVGTLLPASQAERTAHFRFHTS